MDGTDADSGTGLQREIDRLSREVEGLRRENADLRRTAAEALERQTATAEVLKAIASSPTELQPILDAVAENSARLCETYDALIVRVDGDALRAIAHYGPLADFDPAAPLPFSRALPA